MNKTLFAISICCSLLLLSVNVYSQEIAVKCDHAPDKIWHKNGVVKFDLDKKTLFLTSYDGYKITHIVNSKMWDSSTEVNITAEKEKSSNLSGSIYKVMLKYYPKNNSITQIVTFSKDFPSKQAKDLEILYEGDDGAYRIMSAYSCKF